MTQQEIENELKSLREQVSRCQQLEEARRRNWRPIRKGAAICGVVFVLGGIGLLVFSAIYPDVRHETLQSAIMFVLLSIPMSLLGAALR